MRNDNPNVMPFLSSGEKRLFYCVRNIASSGIDGASNALLAPKRRKTGTGALNLRKCCNFLQYLAQSCPRRDKKVLCKKKGDGK